MEGRETQPKKNLLGLLGHGLIEELKGAVKVAPEKIKPKDINEITVAKTILNYLGTRVLERLGKNKWANPFTIVTVMANAGYVGLLDSTDYREKFPDEYHLFRNGLQKLADEEALQVISAEPDRHKESIFYQVVNEDILRAVSERPSSVETSQVPHEIPDQKS